jgi:hypothetical protein
MGAVKLHVVEVLAIRAALAYCTAPWQHTHVQAAESARGRVLDQCVASNRYVAAVLPCMLTAEELTPCPLGEGSLACTMVQAAAIRAVDLHKVMHAQARLLTRRQPRAHL